MIVGAHYASAAWSLADKGLPITYVAPKEGAPTGDIRIHIVEGTKNRAAAEKFVDFAVAKEQASCMSEKLYVGPATKGVTLSDKAKSRLPWGKDGSVANLALIDWSALNAQAPGRHGSLEQGDRAQVACRSSAAVPDNALDELIRATSLVKHYGDVVALDGVSLSVQEGEFLALLGPSGCGKTTLLRTIAGFIEPTSGDTFHRRAKHDRRGAQPPPGQHRLPELRAVSAYDGRGEHRLRAAPPQGAAPRGRSRWRGAGAGRHGGLRRALSKRLSGGQQQRVALARAIINRPKVLLLDEPLGALDQKLRKRMQLELKHLQARLGITFIFVTHDQEEALVMADRIAVLRDGRVMQVGSGEEIYRNPSSRFVASFIGDANLLAVSTEDGTLRLSSTGTILPYVAKGGAAQVLMVRPEDMTIGEAKAADAVGVEAIVRERIFLGDAMRVHAMLGDREEIVLQSGSMAAAEALEPGDRVAVHWPRDKARLLDA